MRVIVAKSAGFCWGVKRAVAKARCLCAEQPEPVYTDGPLLHNKQLLDQLAREGVRSTARAGGLRRGVLLIRAHGITPARRARLNRLRVPVFDATCGDVARIQGLIGRHAAKGNNIVIFGDKGHAEVTGLLGYAAGRGYVVSRPSEVKRLPPLSKVCLVSQSTQCPDCYAQVAAAVRRRFPDAIVLKTICRATRNRQKELVHIAAKVDALVIVGDTKSANTMRLVKLARTLKPTIFIQTAGQIVPGRLRRYKTVGLTAGASTPDFVIEAVRIKLETL